MASDSLHEDSAALTVGTIDQHRAIASVMEELEAVDWYAQRAEATSDEELRDILAHNRDEEKEHAAMVIEWLRRRDPTFDEQLRTYLFTEGPITRLESVAMGRTGGEETQETDAGSTGTAGADGSLGIGSLRGSENL